jgi:ferritin-like metal-binding protein YciE
MVDVQEMPSNHMSHLHKRSETTLGCVTANRAVADGPNGNGRTTSSAPGQRRRGCVALKGWNIVSEVALRRGNVSPMPQMECAMTAKDKDLNDLFLDTLKDIYFAEKQILKALPKMAKAASSDKLRAAFEKHHGETEGQVERLEQVFELIEKPARGKTCDAIQGILDEGKEIMDEYKGCEALDAGMIAAAQAVEHYEISRYGTLKQWAQQLGLKDAVRLLDQTLQEEKKTDESLTSLAEASVNIAAAA